MTELTKASLDCCFFDGPQTDHPDLLSKLRIKLQPGAKQSKVLSIYDADQLKVQIMAPPIDGAANEMLIKFFRKLLSIKGSEIHIAKGTKSHSKVLEIKKPKEWIIQKIIEHTQPKLSK